MIRAVLSLCWGLGGGLPHLTGGEYILRGADFIILLFCSEERVIEHYKLLKGLSRGQAIVQ